MMNNKDEMNTAKGGGSMGSVVEEGTLSLFRDVVGCDVTEERVQTLLEAASGSLEQAINIYYSQLQNNESEDRVQEGGQSSMKTQRHDDGNFIKKQHKISQFFGMTGSPTSSSSDKRGDSSCEPSSSVSTLSSPAASLRCTVSSSPQPTVVTPEKVQGKRNRNTDGGENLLPEIQSRTPKRQRRLDWEQRREEIIDKYSSNEYLLRHHLGQLRQEQDRIQLNDDKDMRDEAKKSRQSSSQKPAATITMTEQQKEVAEHPPSIPLSVRAGAGTGKTQTMVNRAIQLVEKHGVDPGKILILTFTNKAAGEMKERIRSNFEQRFSNSERGKCKEFNKCNYMLPTCKTFHSLAYRWIRTFWKQCGLRRYPTPLVTPVEQRKFMKTVIEQYVKNIRLKRVCKHLGVDRDDGSGKALSTSICWKMVIEKMKDRYPNKYAVAVQKAEDKFEKGTKKKSKQVQATKKQVESTVKEGTKKKSKQVNTTKKQVASAVKKGTKKKLKQVNATKKQVVSTVKDCQQQEERRILMASEIETQCYLELRKMYTSASCELTAKWSASMGQCSLYLKLVENARLGQHNPNEYIPDDGNILSLYESMQATTGHIDFDKMLTLFVRLLRENQDIAENFHSLYDYVIVDEYQDNSDVQSELLLQIVKDGRITVVGDDDQCIYGFRGASPGNFESFRKHFSERSHVNGDNIKSEQKILENNYRSTGNILRVGATLLKGMHFTRGPKTLLSTREEGEKVEFWECNDPDDQAKRIAKAIKNRRENGAVSWGQIACLYRCFRMGSLGVLHTSLQKELSVLQIPFKIIGGSSFLESEVVRDIHAYLSLAVTGSQGRANDGAFARVLNKPPRGLPGDALKLIQAQQTIMNNEDTGQTSLEEASRALLKSDSVLTKSRRRGLENYLKLIDSLRIAAVHESLEILIQRNVWELTGLAEWHAKKKKTEKRKSEIGKANIKTEEDRDELDGESDASDNSTVGETRRKQGYVPQNVEIFFNVAQAYADNWKEKYSVGCSDAAACVDSLFDLAKKALIRYAKENQWHPQVHLPQHFLDDLHIPEDAAGLPVVSSFLADLALQIAVSKDEEGGEGGDDRVTISTIHRAKGLEWEEVYVPYFNEGFMPTKFREADETIPTRHQPNCAARLNDGRKCNLDCERYYCNMASRRRGNLNPEQRHDDEERRLAHVAATRAKDRLVFVSVRNIPGNGNCAVSSFLGPCLQMLPPETVKSINF